VVLTAEVWCGALSHGAYSSSQVVAVMYMGGAHLRVDADVIGDDKLQTREAHTCQHTETSRQSGGRRRIVSTLREIGPQCPSYVSPW
jgi:hypothetical protein